jgi:hypothetical protein
MFIGHIGSNGNLSNPKTLRVPFFVVCGDFDHALIKSESNFSSMDFHRSLLGQLVYNIQLKNQCGKSSYFSFYKSKFCNRN